MRAPPPRALRSLRSSSSHALTRTPGRARAPTANFKDMRRAFKHIDLDNSGTLNKKELKHAIYLMNVSMSDEQFDYFWQQWGDADGSGEVWRMTRPCPRAPQVCTPVRILSCVWHVHCMYAGRLRGVLPRAHGQEGRHHAAGEEVLTRVAVGAGLQRSAPQFFQALRAVHAR